MVTDEETGKRTINGHGSVFNSESQDLGGFREIIMPGAFDGVLEQSDVRCLINHDANKILGRNKSGTLTLNVDSTGLSYACELPDTTYARDLAVSLDRGDITQSSFAFTMDWSKEGRREDGGTHEWELREDGSWFLRIYRVKELFDVSPVTYPAYEAADVRSAQSALQRAIDRKQEAIEAKEQEEREAQQAIARADEARQRKIKIQMLTAAI